MQIETSEWLFLLGLVLCPVLFLDVGLHVGTQNQTNYLSQNCDLNLMIIISCHSTKCPRNKLACGCKHTCDVPFSRLLFPSCVVKGLSVACLLPVLFLTPGQWTCLHVQPPVSPKCPHGQWVFVIIAEVIFTAAVEWPQGDNKWAPSLNLRGKHVMFFPV